MLQSQEPFCLFHFDYTTFAQDHKRESSNLIPLNWRVWSDLQSNGYFSINRFFKNPQIFQQFVSVLFVSQRIDNETWMFRSTYRWVFLDNYRQTLLNLTLPVQANGQHNEYIIQEPFFSYSWNMSRYYGCSSKIYIN